ncbi:uncharacterized protein LOC106162764 [Lingula anatina]|uniref:Uncharacterized protein LOC106162764 n=1 Tax=Lingula anatina TaxID=7574 RepID=A0A1S3IBT5_LINAN|nr:uncharacterized protein LOC106162764 [Lingula anatina]|eukprot:XP_013395633.1 uncharacterized protein LOC106162764 [Lingula anatina]
MSESVQVRQQLSSALDTLRQLISNGELILFLGEQASCLPQPASVEDWWKHLGDLDKEDAVGKIDQLESNMRENQQWLHTILRTLGRFPIIFNVNPDRLVEHYLIRPGDNVQTVRLDRVGSLSGTWPNDHRVLLIKCFGDASYDEKDKLTSASKNYMETFHSMASEETAFVENLFHQHSILFLGCEKDHPLHKAFMERFVKHSKGQHYLFQRGTTSSYFQDDHLTTIQTDMEINEFAQYLTPGSTEFKIRAPGEVYEHSYLPTQREQYLKAQLTLEAAASEIGFHTAKVTNALATDEALEAESRGNLEKMFKNDPFIGQYDARTVQGAMDAMKGRRDNLLKLIQNGVRVTAIFRFDTFEKDIVDASTKKDVRQRNVRKYASVLLQSRSVLNNQSMLELRVVQDMNEEQTKRMKEQYAVIRLKGSSDEAIAYASPAVEGKKNVSINLISVNGTEAARKRKIFEESREAAWDHEKSMLNLTTALLQADEELKAISTEDRNKLQRLYNVQMLTKTEIEPGTWEKLGEGSFGAVFKVQWKGKEMAYKVLQKISKADDLEEFEGEYQSLKKIHHPNIISVAEMYRTDNPIQLGILMEYMSGGSVRDVMNENPGQGQSKDFVSRLAMQVACALDYLHSLKPAIIHRDIKADNIFMTADKQTFKLGDFGLSRITYSTYQTKTMGWGCYRYMAPEMGRTQKYSPKVDVYAFGELTLTGIWIGCISL